MKLIVNSTYLSYLLWGKDRTATLKGVAGKTSFLLCAVSPGLGLSLIWLLIMDHLAPVADQVIDSVAPPLMLAPGQDPIREMHDDIDYAEGNHQAEPEPEPEPKPEPRAKQRKTRIRYHNLSLADFKRAIEPGTIDYLAIAEPDLPSYDVHQAIEAEKIFRKWAKNFGQPFCSPEAVGPQTVWAVFGLTKGKSTYTDCLDWVSEALAFYSETGEFYDLPEAPASTPIKDVAHLTHRKPEPVVDKLPKTEAPKVEPSTIKNESKPKQDPEPVAAIDMSSVQLWNAMFEG